MSILDKLKNIGMFLETNIIKIRKFLSKNPCKVGFVYLSFTLSNKYLNEFLSGDLVLSDFLIKISTVVIMCAVIFFLLQYVIRAIKFSIDYLMEKIFPIIEPIFEAGNKIYLKFFDNEKNQNKKKFTNDEVNAFLVERATKEEFEKIKLIKTIDGKLTKADSLFITEIINRKVAA
jgi:hypothetical protein